MGVARWRPALLGLAAELILIARTCLTASMPAVLACVAAPALAVPPKGMTAEMFAYHRTQNMVDAGNGQGAECPAVRNIDCTRLATARGGHADIEYSCRFEERVGSKWLPAKGTLARFGENWDFNRAALRRCTYQ